MTMKVADVRREYGLAGLAEADLAADPIEQFQRWLDQAMAADPQEFTAMTLATADRAGRPSARVVLLKGVDERGFVFYTHYASRKGMELLENPRAALVFYWAPLDRQVRVEGTVEKASRAESEAYFASRPPGSRLGAWASPQSRPIAGRGEIERLWEEAGARFPDGRVPLPDDWGGFRVHPEAIEFWQGRPSRLHDRLLYSLLPAGGWRVERLAP
jgi:pyridoxamine 5'-phosphate oxidase